MKCCRYWRYGNHSRMFFCNHPTTTEIYTLSLHDALPNYARDVGVDLAHLGSDRGGERDGGRVGAAAAERRDVPGGRDALERSEEHTSELQSRHYLACRLLLETKQQHSTCMIKRLRL